MSLPPRRVIDIRSLPSTTRAKSSPRDTGLGFERSDGVVIIQIFQQGRSTEQKVAAYAELAKRLDAECGVRPEDLIISMNANRHVDWSFGLGRAQFIDGSLTHGDMSPS
jgi:hypothetical protein